MTVNQFEADQKTEESSGTQQVSGDTPGTLIRRAREAAGLTRAELSERMCFIGDKLSLLENDDYDRLPAALYIKGYIRNIAKELNVDEAPILKAYSGYCGEEEESRAILDHVQRDSVAEPGGRSKLPGLALLPLIAVAGVFWWMNGRDFTPPAVVSAGVTGSAAETAAESESVEDLAAPAGPAEERGATAAGQVAVEDELVEESSGDIGAGADSSSAVAVAASADTVDTDAPDGAGQAGVDAPTAAAVGRAPEPQSTAPAEEAAPEPAVAVAASPATDEAAGDSVNETSPASATEAAAAAAAEAAAEQARLQLSFAEEAWVEVKDGKGSVLVAKLQPAGSEVDLRGEPPFRLMLGNAAATEVRFEGELVNSDPLGNRRTRRITVGD
ncbi:RodZ domain-containing protein [Microbulbifer sediminum]|uniref:RodZ domain-containing protein n=1 Tax=Microbulbifer sediminum TaxID=2904250 RepID=UPI001F309E50|nr:RodZ domain-containing protein [Microbulbifer sediminum]